jgi:hypothetical protein
MSKTTHASASHRLPNGEVYYFELDVPTPYAPGVVLDEIRRVVNEGLATAERDAIKTYEDFLPAEDAEPD